YKLRVYALGDGVNYLDSGYSVVKAVKTKVAADPVQLDVPTIKTTTSTANSVTVAWNPVANASGYVVEYKSSTAASYTVAPATTNTTLVVPNLLSDTTYKLRVYALGDGVNYLDSDYSAVKAVKTKAAASATVADYNAATRQATLTWAPIDGAATYKIQLSKDGGATWTSYRTGITTVSATVNGLYAGKTYGFRVYGVASSGANLDYAERLFAPVAVSTQSSTFVESAPVSVSVNASETAQYTVAWFVVTDDGDVAIPDAANKLEYTPPMGVKTIKVVVTGTGNSAPSVSETTLTAREHALNVGQTGPYDTVNRNVATTWNLVDGATSYRFLKDVDGSWARAALITVENGVVTSGNATIADGKMTYTINMFNAGLEGKFRVVAVNQQGWTLDAQEFSYTNFGLELDHEAYDLAGDSLVATTIPGTNAQYQWHVSNNYGSTWAPIAGATRASLQLSLIDAANLSWYKLVATDGDRQSVAYARPALVEAPSAFTVQVDNQNQLVMNFVGVGGAESYQIEYFFDDSDYPVWINLPRVSYASATSHGLVSVTATHPNGENYAGYSLRVRALASDGWSEWVYSSANSTR
ncbi:MAG: fibronectin type III domain-containing protein, partial [Thermoguttaceae bacterium]|nr:fibronectin type III domain-containing protein [Thermoguttaceae bacterium]